MHPGGPAFGVVSLQGVCIQGSWADPLPPVCLPVGGGGEADPPKRYMVYYGIGQQAGSTHATGMHSSLNSNFSDLFNLLSKFEQCKNANNLVYHR